MYCEQRGKWFYFDKELLEPIMAIVKFGVIKDYGHFMVLEPLPEIIAKGEYDFIIIEGMNIGWNQVVYQTKDRLKALTGDMETPDEVEIIGFYSKKYNEYDLGKLFSEIPGVEKIPFFHSDRHWFGFNFDIAY